MTATADVIVVGLGAMGSAALYQLSRRGAGTLGLDRHAPPHDRGSSHGETRITRQAIGEGEEYVPLVLRSHAIWRELEAATGERLLEPVGGLLLGRPGGSLLHHGKADFVKRTIAAAERFHIAHEILTAREVQARFPAFRLDGDEVGYFEPGAGLVHPERCVAAQLGQARALGARIHTGEAVTRIEPDRNDVAVVTDRGRYVGSRVIVTAGAWIPRLLGPPLADVLRVYRQILHWFAVDEPATFTPGRFPIFIWIHGEGESDYFYGLPLLSDGIKLGTEQFEHATDPDTVDRQVATEESRAMHANHVASRLAGVSARCLRATMCLYTTTPDSGFVIDRHPDHEAILVASACSGHGFKHSAAIGEALADLALTGNTGFDLSPFALSRFRSPIRP